MALERSRAQEQEPQAKLGPHVDYLEAEFEPEVARRASNTALRRELASVERKASGAAPAHKQSDDDQDVYEHDSAAGETSAADRAGTLFAAQTANVGSGAQRKHAGPTAAAQAPSTQLRAKPTVLEFDSVVGRATLTREVTITNNSDRYVGGMPRIEGTNGGAFSLVIGGAGFIAPPERDNKDREIVSVKYHAPAPGTHSATLVLPTELGELRIALTGRALDIGGHAKTLGDGQGPEPVHDIADAKPKNRKEGRAVAMDAADAVSSLARTAEETVYHGSAARDHFSAQLLAAGASLNTRILRWAHEEGLDRVESMKQDTQGGAADFIKLVLIKTGGTALKLAGKENPVTLLALEAVDLGWGLIAGRGANQDADARARGYEEHMGDVMGFALPATDAATKALAIKFASLMSRYAVARADMLRIAGAEAQEHIEELHKAIDQNNLDKQTSAIARADRLLDKFKEAQANWAHALRQIAGAGSNAQQVANGGFNALMDKYVEFRAGGNTEIADHERKVSCLGQIDFGEPWNIQHTGFSFGKFSGPTATIRGHINQKRLAELGAERGNPPRPGWQVNIRLTELNGDGAVVLKQGADGTSTREHKFEGNIEARVGAIGGVEKLWSMLDSVNLGTHVIWGGKR